MALEHPLAEGNSTVLACPQGTPLFVQTSAGHYYSPEVLGDRLVVHVWNHDVDELLRRGFTRLPNAE